MLFDLDGTLLDRDSSLAQFIEQQYNRFATALQHIPRPAWLARFIELDAHGYRRKQLVYQQLIGEFEITKLPWQILFDDYDSQFHRACIGFPALEHTLNTLRHQCYTLGIITNGRTQFQMRNIRALGIEHYFAAILVSESEGIRKPAPEIFRRAIERLGVTASESVFVGDNPEADIGGAQTFGMKAIWKRSAYWPPPASADATCDGLGELPTLVQQLDTS